MSILDAKELPDGHRDTADVCVIGGGPAGITVALGLEGSGLDVVLLEGGRREFDEELQDLYAGETAGVHYYELDETRLRMLGGSSNHWEGYCRPLAPEDFDGSYGAPAWPLGLAELEPHYRRAQELCQLPPYDYSAESWAQKLGARLIDLDTSSVRNDVIHRGPPTRFGAAYEAQLEASERTRVHLNANVVELVADRDRVTSARFAQLDGRTGLVEARWFVLATGGIENARLLLSSDDARPGGLGNEHDLVGRYFTEHTHVDKGRLLLPADHDLGFYVDGAPVGDATVQGMLTIDPQVRATLGVGNIAAMLMPATDRLGDGRAARVAQMVAHDLLGIDDIETEVRFQVMAEQEPNPKSRVELMSARDSLGMRRCRLTWDLTPRDLHTLRAGIEVFAGQLGGAGLGPMKSPWHDDFTDADLHGGHHHLGTTRMDEDPRRGVVGADCRVHGLANLYIGGSSVFPGAGYANPTLTLVALADRLAAKLREVD